jgi:hypothetical protein
MSSSELPAASRNMSLAGILFAANLICAMLLEYLLRHSLSAALLMPFEIIGEMLGLLPYVLVGMSICIVLALIGILTIVNWREFYVRTNQHQH